MFNKKNFLFYGSIIFGLLVIWMTAFSLVKEQNEEERDANIAQFEKIIFHFEEKLNSYIYGLQGMAGVIRVKKI